MGRKERSSAVRNDAKHGMTRSDMVKEERAAPRGKSGQVVSIRAALARSPAVKHVVLGFGLERPVKGADVRSVGELPAGNRGRPAGLDRAVDACGSARAEGEGGSSGRGKGPHVWLFCDCERGHGSTAAIPVLLDDHAPNQPISQEQKPRMQTPCLRVRPPTFPSVSLLAS